MRTLIRPILTLALLCGCLIAGFAIGPGIRGFYERLFPQPAFVRGDYSALYRSAGKPIVVFTTSTCPYCRRARELLVAAHADFRDFVIDLSDADEQRFIALGGESVPTLYIGDRRIVGLREDTIRESLALLQQTKQ